MIVFRACLIALPCLLLADDSALAQDFTDIAEEAGIDYQHHGFMYVGGIAVADFDDDGFQDIYDSVDLLGQSLLSTLKTTR